MSKTTSPPAPIIKRDWKYVSEAVSNFLEEKVKDARDKIEKITERPGHFEVKEYKDVLDTLMRRVDIVIKHMRDKEMGE